MLSTVNKNIHALWTWTEPAPVLTAVRRSWPSTRRLRAGRADDIYVNAEPVQRVLKNQQQRAAALENNRSTRIHQHLQQGKSPDDFLQQLLVIVSQFLRTPEYPLFGKRFSRYHTRYSRKWFGWLSPRSCGGHTATAGTD